MFASLLPKSAPFFEMLLEQNRLLCHMAEQNLELFNTTEKRHITNISITKLENDADALYRRITRSLSATFITPIDREDILRISQVQEECMDRFQRLSIRITAYDMPHMLFPAQRVAFILKEMIDLTTDMLLGLTRRKDAHKTKLFRTKHEECDSLLAIGLAEVMDASEKQNNCVATLKWIQMYEALEFVIRKVSDLFEHIEEAVMKNV
ncbi:MAG: DUF47 family protein [Desulfovibrionaceae bacterium]|nr:DUF47 family protein [Desulfovibrionaceae bacterium]